MHTVLVLLAHPFLLGILSRHAWFLSSYCDTTYFSTTKTYQELKLSLLLLWFTFIPPAEKIREPHQSWWLVQKPWTREATHSNSMALHQKCLQGTGCTISYTVGWKMQTQQPHVLPRRHCEQTVAFGVCIEWIKQFDSHQHREWQYGGLYFTVSEVVTIIWECE